MPATVATKTIRLANPHTKTRKPNPQITSLGFKNGAATPKKGPKHMAVVPAKKKANGTRVIVMAAPAKKKNGKARNGLFSKQAAPVAAPKRKKRKKNPEFFKRGADVVQQGAAALVGFAACRQIPQMLLKEKNKGVIGYGTLIATAVAVSMAITSVAGPDLGGAALIGGGMQLTSRALNEFVSPVGSMLAVSGVGDAMAAGLGEIRKGYFPVPVVTEPGSFKPIIPEEIRNVPQIAAPQANTQAAAAAGMGNVRRVFRSPYAA